MVAIIPYTILLLVYRLPSLTPTAFKNYYETTHIPLLKSLTGPLFPDSHTRHYISRTANTSGDNRNGTYPAMVIIGTQQDFEYDAIAELMFANQTAFQAFLNRVSQPEVAQKIANDEDRFIDRARLRAVVLGSTTVTRRSGGRTEGGDDDAYDY